MNRPARYSFLILIAGFSTVATGDEIYRWTDKDGMIHFSSQPPLNGDYKRITPAPPPPTSAPGVDALRKRAQAIDSDNTKVAKARQDALKAKAEDAEKCAKARERLAYLDEHPAHRLFTVGADGAESRMTDEQYEAEVAKAKGVAADSCN
jgi:N-acetyl-beta-hexosaminidase